MAAGFFHCAHCGRVVEISERVQDEALALPDGRLVDLRCPACHRPSVSWREESPSAAPPVPAEDRPVSEARGRELFAEIRKAIE